MAYGYQIVVFAVSFLITGFLLLSLPQLTIPAYAGLPGLATCCNRTQTMQGPICIDPNDDCTIDFEGNSCGTCDPSDLGQPCECSTTSPSPSAIPTLDQWGKIITIAVIGLFAVNGLIALRRRNAAVN